MLVVTNKVKQYQAWWGIGFNVLIIENEFDQWLTGFFKVNEIRAKSNGAKPFLVRSLFVLWLPLGYPFTTFFIVECNVFTTLLLPPVIGKGVIRG